MGKNDFYNSEISKASVKITSDESDEDGETISLVFKCPVSKGLGRVMHKMIRPFMKETIWYKRGLPYLARYHPVIKTLAPDCLYATVNVENDYHRGPLHSLAVACFPLRKGEVGVIVLEDLTQRRGCDNYNPTDKDAVLSYDHVRIALEGLAHFHGAWWQSLHGKGGIEPKEGTGDITARDMKDLYDQKWPKFMIKGLVGDSLKSMAVLMENVGRDPTSAERLRKLGQSQALVDRVYALTEDSKFQTIVHGDFWSNNMMFHCDEEGKPDKVRFFDYQMMMVGHPVQDIW